ncbi:MAG: TIM barrel protein [Saprospiraceae bacterium]|nr:TIM barrel protein [Saprospiraceae bacterium]
MIKQLNWLFTVCLAIFLIGCANQPSDATDSSTSENADTVTDEANDFKISLAQWSLHNTFFGESLRKDGGTFFRQMIQEDPAKVLMGEESPDDFPRIAAEQFDIFGIELVNTFYRAHENDQAYWDAFKAQCDEFNVQTLLIMCDGLGSLGNADAEARMQAVENHYPWVDIAAFLGCHSIRVNAAGEGTAEEVAQNAAAGLKALTAYAKEKGINVIVENHGGYSSDGQWLAGVISAVDDDYCGTLPDYGNFCIKGSPRNCEEPYDRYQGMADLLPFAKGVSAKSYGFDESGNETTIDFFRMHQLVRDANFSGYIGVEYEGSEMSEAEGIKATKSLLEKTFTS